MSRPRVKRDRREKWTAGGSAARDLHILGPFSAAARAAPNVNGARIDRPRRSVEVRSDMKERSGTSRHAPGRWARVLGLAIVYWVLSGVIPSPRNHGLGASDRGSRDAEGDRAVAVTGAMSMSGLLTDAEDRGNGLRDEGRV